MKPGMTENLPERVDVIERKLDALASSVDARFDQVDKRFAAVDKRFDEVDKRFDEVDKRFEEVSAAFVEQRQYTEFAFDRLRGEMIERFELVATKEQVDRIERKLDQFIDSIATTRRRRRPGRPKKR